MAAIIHDRNEIKNIMNKRKGPSQKRGAPITEVIIFRLNQYL